MSKLGPNTTKEFAALLRDLSVERLILEFAGGGDSGQIEYAYCYDADGKLLDYDLCKNLPGFDETFDETLHGWFMPFVRRASDLEWQINAGGSGTLNFNLGDDEPGITLEITQLIEDYEEQIFSMDQIMQGEI